MYVSRDAILRRRTEYDMGEYESQRDRDYEKYHSDWGGGLGAGGGGGEPWGGGGEPGGGEPGGDGGEPGGDGGEPGGGVPDHYGLLGVGRDAAPSEIKARYRELAKEAHPDRAGRSGGGGGKKGRAAPAGMVEINRAYEVLSDPQARRRYDRLLGGAGGGDPD